MAIIQASTVLSLAEKVRLEATLCLNLHQIVLLFNKSCFVACYFPVDSTD